MRNHWKTAGAMLFIPVALALLPSCRTNGAGTSHVKDVPAAAGTDLASTTLPLLNTYCVSCHGGQMNMPPAFLKGGDAASQWASLLPCASQVAAALNWESPPPPPDMLMPLMGSPTYTQMQQNPNDRQAIITAMNELVQSGANTGACPMPPGF